MKSKRSADEEVELGTAAKKHAKMNKDEGAVLALVLKAIRSLKSHSGSSVKAILKEISKGGAVVDEGAVKKTVKEAVANGVLEKEKQSFLVSGDAKYPDLSDKVTFTDLVIGSGERVVGKGDIVEIKYRGTLASNDQEFDKGNLKFQVFGGEVVKGFDHSCLGMRSGGKRHCQIPASLGYGKRGSPPEIPPNADLVFEIELIRLV